MFVKGFSSPPNASGSSQCSGSQVIRSFSCAKKAGAELFQQYCCVVVVHGMPFPAGTVVRVMCASGVDDFEQKLEKERGKTWSNLCISNQKGPLRTS